MSLGVLAGLGSGLLPDVLSHGSAQARVALEQPADAGLDTFDPCGRAADGQGPGQQVEALGVGKTLALEAAAVRAREALHDAPEPAHHRPDVVDAHPPVEPSDGQA